MPFGGADVRSSAMENRLINRIKAMLDGENPVEAILAEFRKITRASKDKVEQSQKGWLNCVESNRKLKAENSQLGKEKRNLQKANTTLERKLELAKRDKALAERKLAEKEKSLQEAVRALAKAEAEKQDLEGQNAALKEEIAKQYAIRDHDGTTSGISTSRTPIGKTKVIPNSSEKTGRHKGGQPGHEKHVKAPIPDDQVTETVDHYPEVCPECGKELGQAVDFSAYTRRDEEDYVVKVIKKRNIFYQCHCPYCGKEVKAAVPPHLHAPLQYGASIKTFILSLLGTGFVSIGRTRDILGGLLRENTPSIGYIGSLQGKAVRLLKVFRKEVAEACKEQRILHWDDTVIFINTKRGCLRFYGNKLLSIYFAHDRKDAAGIEQDSIIGTLGPDNFLMHDHLLLNYRKEYRHNNLECVQHLQRELQKIANDTKHEWAESLKEVISTTIHQRKELLKKGVMLFTVQEARMVEEKIRKYLELGKRECERDQSRYFYHDESNLIKRIEEYKKNYFAWIYDFTLPATNNLAESGLRMCKTKQKVSGQFQNERTADEFALLQTYLGTCKKFGIDAYEALERLVAGKPFTLQELFDH